MRRIKGMVGNAIALSLCAGFGFVAGRLAAPTPTTTTVPSQPQTEAPQASWTGQDEQTVRRAMAAAQTLSNRDRNREALATLEELLPQLKRRQSESDEASRWCGLVLNAAGTVLMAMSRFSEARTQFEEALTLPDYRKAGASRAAILRNLGDAWFYLQENERALSCYKEALDYERSLGRLGADPKVAAALDRHAVVMMRTERTTESRALSDEAARMWDTEIDRAKLGYATSLNNRAAAMRELARRTSDSSLLREAAANYELALRLRREAFSDRSEGHVDLVFSLNNLGMAQLDLGDTTEALAALSEADEVARRLYDERQYPHGHGDLAMVRRNLGAAVYATGDINRASVLLLEAVDAEHRLVEALFAGASEAEAMAMAAANLRSPDLLIEAALAGHIEPLDFYRRIWTRRGMVFRLMHLRQQQLRREQSADPALVDLLRRYNAARDELARLLIAKPIIDPTLIRYRLQRLGELNELKRQLEAEIAHRYPDVLTHLHRDPITPATLAERLPAGAVFIDLLKFRRRSDLERDRPAYFAVVITRGSMPQLVDLGPAHPIDEAIDAWRVAILDRRSFDASPLRDMVWAKLLEKFDGEAVRTVYLCPDSKLTALPWCALPADAAGSPLIARYAVASAPHGRMLAEWLEAASGAASSADESDYCLLVGDVKYAAEKGRATWDALPGTAKEIGLIRAMASGRQVVALTGAESTPQAVLAQLARAKTAHLATHGFFADPSERSWFQTDAEGVSMADQLTDESRRVIAGRNPLALSGLVLAASSSSHDDLSASLLTGESIAGRRFDALDLVVLSACDTARGDVAGGEGVLGLQRAFHLAGARHVVASLWAVDDDATVVLMHRFYRWLWKHGRSPAEALRLAQLDVLRHPSLIYQFAEGKALADTLPPDDEASPDARAPIWFWAAFTLSGVEGGRQ